MSDERLFHVRLLREVRSDWPFTPVVVAKPGGYTARVNPQGAASVMVSGYWLGVKPEEFEWLDEPPPEAPWYARRIWLLTQQVAAACHPSFVCPRCTAASWHPEDAATGYCARCCEFTGAIP